jgi:hypothetical protein
MRASTSGAMRAFVPEDAIADAMVVPVYEHTLRQLGWTGVLASREAPDAAVRRLLDREAIGPLHFWHRLSLSPDRDAIGQLYELESRGKRVEIFFYYGIPQQRDAAPVLFATASVASRIGDSFVFRGLPVLNRCVIAPRYRNVGLYGALLRHRFDYCRMLWGDELLGVHVATAHAGVVRALRRDIDGSPFLYLGSHYMGDPANRAVTAAFAWFPRAMRRRMLVSPDDREHAQSTAWRRFESVMIRLLENRFVDGDYGELLRRADHVLRVLGRAPQQDEGRRELFALFAAVPVNPGRTPGMPADVLAELENQLL